MGRDRRILSVANDAKTVKGNRWGFLTGVLYLLPAKRSGFNVCQYASKGCAASCLNEAGRGVMQNVQAGRLRKTLLFFQDRKRFMSDLFWSVEALLRQAAREALTPCVRLNGTSDLAWERIAPELFAEFSGLQFYDYTKVPGRYDLPDNYHLTFSRSEENDGSGPWGEHVAAELARGRNVAAVFDARKGSLLPETYKGRHVLDGDLNDLRFLDETDANGLWVGLRSKGPAKKDRSGFVLPVLNSLTCGRAA